METLPQPHTKKTAAGVSRERTVNVAIPEDMHRELKIASAHRNEELRTILFKSWESFKKQEGKNLHKPQERKQDVA